MDYMPAVPVHRLDSEEDTRRRRGEIAMAGNGKKFRCKSEAQKKAIRRSYAIKAKQKDTKHVSAPYPHFRYYKKSGHPALIVGEQPKDEYRYRKVMHSEKDCKRTNEKIEPNPKPGDPDPMYIGKRVRHDKKLNFEPRPLPWKYPKK